MTTDEWLHRRKVFTITCKHVDTKIFLVNINFDEYDPRKHLWAYEVDDGKGFRGSGDAQVIADLYKMTFGSEFPNSEMRYEED